MMSIVLIADGCGMKVENTVKLCAAGLCRFETNSPNIAEQRD